LAVGAVNVVAITTTLAKSNQFLKVVFFMCDYLKFEEMQMIATRGR
jgi:hypothetical protein